MKISFESVFNDSGSSADPEYSRKFLAQRKWIILLATAVFLLHQEYVILDGSIGPISFDIDSTAAYFIRSLSGASILFGLYMLMCFHDYLTKYRVHKREKFDHLQIEEQDTYSESIESMKSQMSGREKEIETEFNSARDIKSNISKLESVLTSLDGKYPEAKNWTDKKEFQGGLNVFAPKKAELDAPIFEVLRTEQTKSKLLLGHNAMDDPQLHSDQAGMVRKSLSADLETANTNLGKINQSINRLRADHQQLSGQVEAAVLARARINDSNRRRWKLFFVSGLLADVISMVPASVALIYCTFMFCSSFEV